MGDLRNSIVKEPSSPIADEFITLAGRDLEYFVRVVESSLKVTNRHHFFLWVQGALQSLLPHRLLLCAFHAPADEVRVEKFSDYVFPSAHFREICCSQNGLIARMVDNWRRGDGQPFLLSSSMDALNQAFAVELGRYELGNVALHCMHDVKGQPCSQFLLARIPGPVGPRYAYMLQLLIPYMHAALMRTQVHEQRQRPVARNARAALTEREAEILTWVQHGKNNSQIGQQLNISPLTVKNHVQNILKKLGVQNRAEAVAKGISQKLISAYSAH